MNEAVFFLGRKNGYKLSLKVISKYPENFFFSFSAATLTARNKRDQL
jgi:hypothetical protein